MNSARIVTMERSLYATLQILFETVLQNGKKGMTVYWKHYMFFYCLLDGRSFVLAKMTL
jgi:hypothetical protein